ncbi:hypothetical protein Ocepr_2373 (plasmid) [Oceanithermus profundus DSM 14977]|uniref:Lipoprotein n=1 Tax=Oceanithermus profundus (strain DSM 14977 / NBRC 100410 / VKM B-2274 / 506) TaxID=670487 RepID=E4UAP2_OCEP5|nr:hypothetical protein [Oceanithermus profundus]ADR37821.1 hypothetical protein Ocepr_2373 [Oceanithermus profundus DSM 14977]
MKRRWILLLALLAGLFASCSLNEQTFPIIGEPVQQEAVFEQYVPTLVDSMTLSLDGQLPDQRGMIFEYDAPQTLLRPSKLTLNLKAQARLDLACADLTAGRLQVQAYLGPPDTLWQNPLGDEITWDLTASTPLELDFATELSTEQRDAVLSGTLALGFTIRSNPDLTIAPNRTATCTTQGPDGSDYTRVLFRFLYEVPELSLTAQIF